MHQPTRTIARGAAAPAVGAARTIRAVSRWLTDADSAQAYADALAAKPHDYLKLRADRDERRRRRAGLLLICLGAAWTTGYVLVWLVGAWTLQVAAVAALAAAAVAGRPTPLPGEAPPRPAVTQPRAGITPAVVVDALTSAVPEIARTLRDNPDAVTFPDPPARQGDGWAVRAELPAGITSGMVAAQHAKLASAFRRAVLAVAIEPDPAHAGMVNLWIGDTAPTGAVDWPHSNTGQVDILEPFPIGVDLRGRPVTVSLRNQNVLIGAQPGYGKTATLRMILLAAALDPRTHIYAYDLKGGVDLLPLEAAAVRVVAGDEDDDLAQLRDDLATVQAEISRRNRMLRQLPPHDRPDGQITTADATRLGLSPLVFAIDEAQIAYASTEYGKEIERLTADVFRRGRSVGIHVLLATQRFDTASVPRVVSTNATLRMCGRVDAYTESNMILGSNAHGTGVSATIFGDNDQGVMWLKGSGQPRIVRMARVTSDQAWRITARAAETRTSTAPLPLPAAPDPAPEGPLARVLAVWPEGQDRAWCSTLAGLLADAYPECTGWTAADVTKALGGHGVTTRAVRIGDTVRKGVMKTDVVR